MYIKKITINNFKIYYGENTIIFPPVSEKNICIVSGDNGYGKTTLLTALVWCLYGNQIQDVDEYFKNRVNAVGGHKYYLQMNMNRLALEENETEYSVSIDLKEVELPGVYCDSMCISRSYNIHKSHDSLRITIDGNPNELIDDIGQQIFIQDFVLPKEIANLFFFDAEKIVRLAEVQSLLEKRLLNQAYSEVLGIKKYDDLKSTLSDLRIRFRRDSATESEQTQFKDLGNEINRIERIIRTKEQTKEQLISNKSDLRLQLDHLQEKLLREGNTLSISEINTFREEKSRLAETQKALLNEFKDLFELAPFAIMGGSLTKIEQQLQIEDKHNKSVIGQDLIKNKVSKIIDELGNDTSKNAKTIDGEIKKYFIARVTELANKHLIDREDVRQEDVKLLHNFNIDESNRFKAVLTNLRTTYKEELQALNSTLRSNKAAYADISKKLLDAESKENDVLISKIREEREEVDEFLRYNDDKTLELSQDIGALENALITTRKLFEEVAIKIKVNQEYIGKDTLVSRLIEELDTFILQIKAKKKNYFKERILANLRLLMHKQGFIDKVEIEVKSDIMNITLFDKRKREIKKEDLSKGEQQLYATALLKSLVEESGIEFPVFVDSPLQKFDDKHSRNVITSFYPKISKQVVILPLKNKELSREEYDLLLENVGCTYSINNIDENSSRFIEVNPLELFDNLN
ncbi:DNA sulfur modification protein DndD [Chloroflexota bacterium]